MVLVVLEQLSKEEIMNNIQITYDLLSTGYYTHATPTMYHAGLRRPQLASCYLVKMKDDSIDGIYDTAKQCALLSKYAGGIGLSIHEIRSAGSYIRGTCGYSNGIAPMLRIFNETVKYVDQCFYPDTPVMTREGYKKIEDISIGDFVLTATGRFNQVSNTMDFKVSKKIYSIKANSSIVKVSGSHPILSSKRDSSNVTYTKVKDLRVGDYVAIPTNSEEVKIDYDISHSWFYGIYLNRGIITEDRSIVLSINKDEQIYNRVQIYLSYFKVESTYDTTNGKLIIPLFQNLRIPINRHILSTKLYRLYQYPYSHIESFVNGFIQSTNYDIVDYLGTQCIMLRGRGSCSDKNLLHLQLIFYRRCIATVVDELSNNIIIPINSEIGSLLNIRPSKDLFYRLDSGCILTPIVHISVTPKGVHYLHDLEIIGEQNYLTPLGIAHNGGGRGKEIVQFILNLIMQIYLIS